MDRALSRKKPKVKSSIHLIILHVKPGWTIRGSGQSQGKGGAEEGGFNRPKHVRSPDSLAQKGRHTAKREREEVDHTLDSAWLGGHVERRSEDCQVRDGALRAIERASIVRAHTPRGVVRRRSNHTYLVATASQPLGHLTRVLADAGKFRREVQTVDQDAQGRPR